MHNLCTSVINILEIRIKALRPSLTVFKYMQIYPTKQLRLVSQHRLGFDDKRIRQPIGRAVTRPGETIPMEL